MNAHLRRGTEIATGGDLVPKGRTENAGPDRRLLEFRFQLEAD